MESMEDWRLETNDRLLSLEENIQQFSDAKAKMRQLEELVEVTEKLISKKQDTLVGVTKSTSDICLVQQTKANNNTVCREEMDGKMM